MSGMVLSNYPFVISHTQTHARTPPPPPPPSFHFKIPGLSQVLRKNSRAFTDLTRFISNSWDFHGLTKMFYLKSWPEMFYLKFQGLSQHEMFHLEFQGLSKTETFYLKFQGLSWFPCPVRDLIKCVKQSLRFSLQSTYYGQLLTVPKVN